MGILKDFVNKKTAQQRSFVKFFPGDLVTNFNPNSLKYDQTGVVSTIDIGSNGGISIVVEFDDGISDQNYDDIDIAKLGESKRNQPKFWPGQHVKLLPAPMQDSTTEFIIDAMTIENMGWINDDDQDRPSQDVWRCELISNTIETVEDEDNLVPASNEPEQPASDDADIVVS